MAISAAVPRVKQISSGGAAFRTVPLSKPNPADQSGGGGGGRVSGGPGQGRGGRQGGRFNPTRSSYGLNLNDPTAFNVFATPRTMGQFNREVLRWAQPSYLPQLQNIQGEVTAEKTAAKERTGDIGQIYGQYAKQAQDAFNETQSALKDLAVQNASGDQTAQANLAAALGSATGGEGSLAQMMGLSAPSGGTLPYTGAASDAAAATQQERAGLASGAIGLQGENLANVGNERATQLNTEDLRHGAAVQGFQSERSALEQQIPGLIEQARQQLISQLENSQALRFQQNLAGQQFGLSKQAQQFNQGQTKAQFRETQINDASNRAAQAAQIRQNAQALASQQAATQTAAQTAIAKAQGQQQVNAIKYLTNFLAPTKQELSTRTITDANGTHHVTGLADPKRWHRDVGSALRTLTSVYGLDLNTALNIMGSVGGSSYISGQGGMTVAQWANSYKQRQAAANNPRTLLNPIGNFSW